MVDCLIKYRYIILLKFGMHFICVFAKTYVKSTCYEQVPKYGHSNNNKVLQMEISRVGNPQMKHFSFKKKLQTWFRSSLLYEFVVCGLNKHFVFI